MVTYTQGTAPTGDAPAPGDWNWQQTSEALGLVAPLFGPKQKGPNFSQAINLFNTLSAQQQQMLNKSVALNQLGINKLAGGFDQARTGVKQASGAAKAESRDIATQAIGSAQNSAIGRGTFNTSTFDSANRGIGSDLAKHLAWIDSQTSGALGGLDTAQAGAEASGYAHLGSLFNNYGSNQAALAGPLLQGMTQAGGKGTSSGGGLGNVLGLAAGVAGLFSDPRLKKNVEQIGVLKHGKRAIPIYTFEYIDPSLPGTYTGVMSPDVRHLGVVSVSPAGFEMVDYDKLRAITGWESKFLGERNPEPRRRRRKVKA